MPFDVVESFADADVVDHFALADDGLRDAADVHVLLHAGHRDFDVQRHFVGRVHLRSHIHIYADVSIVELRGHQRRGGIRLKAAGGIRNAVADFERNLLTIGGAHLRVVQHAGTAIRKESLQ